jgi:phosphoribosylamine--glycine ligase
MRILLIGSGGREHALAWKIAQSPILGKLYIAPGNAGTSSCGENIPLSVTDFEGIRNFALEKKITMLIVGPEDPLVRGIHDFFLADPDLRNIHVIGPKSASAMLEGSKDFAKQFMIRHGIPTAAFRTFDASNISEGVEFLRSLKAPYVLKADGLAAGKGVVICSGFAEAVHELETMIVDARFGSASSKVVIEEFLQGIECSCFILTDGRSYVVLPEAKDYKRIGEGDTGPNTGGMGSVSPVSFADEAFRRKVEEKIIEPTMKGLVKDGLDYTGFIFFGLMNVRGDPYVIEYNCRLGDPETESVIPRIQNDFLELMKATSERRLHEVILQTDPRSCATVMLVSKGYPGNYEKGRRMTIRPPAGDSMFFHAGTTMGPDGSSVLTSGGRVLAVTSLGGSMKEALDLAYLNTEKTDFEGKYFRKDIGFDL